MTIAALTKPIDELTADDINELIDERIREDESVEFKRVLTSDVVKGNGRSESRLRDKAKEGIVKEVVAFANGSGGRLFLGVAEREGAWDTAGYVARVPQCLALAESLNRSCDDAIDPPIFGLKVMGVTTDDDGSGVIVFDVPASQQAPHRSTKSLHFYRRSGTESKQMDVQEIRDTILRKNTRQNEIYAEFDVRTSEFTRYVDSFRAAHEFGYCLRLSFVPLNVVELGREIHSPDVIPELVPLKFAFSDQPDDLRWIQFPQQSFEVRPILRGRSMRSSSFCTKRGRHEIKIDLWSNGGLEIWYGNNTWVDDTLRLYSSWLVTLLANGLRNVARIRRISRLSNLSFQMDVEMQVFGKNVALYDFNEIEILSDRGSISVGDHVLPRSEVGLTDGFNHAVNEFLVDWFNEAGRDWRDEIKVNYRLDG